MVREGFFPGHVPVSLHALPLVPVVALDSSVVDERGIDLRLVSPLVSPVASVVSAVHLCDVALADVVAHVLLYPRVLSAVEDIDHLRCKPVAHSLKIVEHHAVVRVQQTVVALVPLGCSGEAVVVEPRVPDAVNVLHGYRVGVETQHNIGLRQLVAESTAHHGHVRKAAHHVRPERTEVGLIADVVNLDDVRRIGRPLIILAEEVDLLDAAVTEQTLCAALHVVVDAASPAVGCYLLHTSPYKEAGRGIPSHRAPMQMILLLERSNYIIAQKFLKFSGNFENFAL